jgi:hypothetical protein
MKTRSGALLWSVLWILAGTARAQDLPKKYIGESTCIPQLDSPINRYGVRLDKNQKAYLTVYKFRDAEIITIVQYQEEYGAGRKWCGFIRDVTQVPDKDSSVVWDCVDKRIPSQVVIGTWPAKHPKPWGPAVEAWRIDLAELKFVPVKDAPRFVYCRPETRAGNDDGLGLSDDAKKRAAKQSSK